MYPDLTIQEHLERRLGERPAEICDIVGVGELGTPQKVICDGNRFYGDADVSTWPHTMVFDYGGGYHDSGDGITIKDLPHTFEYGWKKFVLRSAILGDRIHFTAMVRFPKGWLHYDGMEKGPYKFMFYSLNDNLGLRGAMNNRRLCFIFYEVMEKNEAREFGDPDFDITTVIGFMGTYNVPTAGSTEGSSSSDKEEDKEELKSDSEKEEKANAKERVADIKEKLDSVTKSGKKKRKKADTGATSSKSKKKRSEKAGERKTESKRLNMGFSFRSAAQKRGKQPRCKGCGISIKYQDKCIKHKYMKKRRDKFETIDQYHCEVGCLSLMEEEHLDQFMEKKWSEKDVRDVVDQLQLESYYS
jgi:hypothetical protein